MKRLTALIIIAAMILLTFASCGSLSDLFGKDGEETDSETLTREIPEKTIVGVWVTELDFGQIFDQSVSEDESFFFSLMGFDFQGVYVDMYILFYDDGTYYSEVDEEQMAGIADELLGDIASFSLGEEGGDMNFSGLFGRLLSNGTINGDEVFNSTRNEGNYDFTDGVLTIDDASFRAELDEDVLYIDYVITPGRNDDSLMNFPAYLMPMELYRIEIDE